MDLYKAIQSLYDEKKKLDRVIAHLEELQHRNPEDAPKRRGRKKMDMRARREVSARMKRYWASRRASGADRQVC